MSQFKKYKLGELSDKITKGTTPTSLGKQFVPSGINFIKAESVTLNGQIDKSKFAYIDLETDEKLRRSRLEEGDILFSMAGIVLGKTAIVTKEHLPANTNQALALIRLKKSIVRPEYVHYYFRQKTIFEWVNSVTAQSAQPNINLSEIGDIDIPLPDLPTQNRIVTILSSLDNKMELNRRTNHTLEQMAQTLYKKYFVDDIDIENLPKGWEWVKLKDLMRLVKKTISQINRDQYLYYLPIDSIPGKSMHLEKFDSINNANSSLIEFLQDDILFGAMRPYFHKVIIAPFNGLTRTTCFVLRPVRKNYISYLYLLMFQDETISFSNQVSQGSTIPYAVWEQGMDEMPCIVATDKVLTEFNELLFPILSKFKHTFFENNILKNCRDLLLPKLMSGEIEVNVPDRH